MSKMWEIVRDFPLQKQTNSVHVRTALVSDVYNCMINEQFLNQGMKRTRSNFGHVQSNLCSNRNTVPFNIAQFNTAHIV